MRKHTAAKTKKALVLVLVLGMAFYAFPAPQARAGANLPDGMVGQIYQIPVPNGYWSIANLPPGLGLRRGAIVGAPTQAGSFTVIGNGGDPLILNVKGRPPYIEPIPCCGPIIGVSNLNGQPVFQYPWDAHQNADFSGYSIYWARSDTPVKWSISAGSLPPGMSLNPANGQFIGKPTLAGRYIFSVTITDVFNLTSTVSYRLNVLSPMPVISLPQPVTWQAAVGESFSKPVTCNCIAGIIYTWSIGSGSLPYGLSLNSSTGIISGTPQNSGEFYPSFILTDEFGQKNSAAVYFKVTPKPLTITSDSNLIDGVKAGTYFTQSLTATGGVGPYKWYPATEDPNLVFWRFRDNPSPLVAGLTLSKNGNLYGAVVAGTYNFSVKVIDAFGAIATKAMTIKVIPPPPTISVVGNDAKVTGIRNIWTNDYVDWVQNAQSWNLGFPIVMGAEPLTWSIIKGSLPPGITFDSTGHEFGCATKPGAYYFTLKVTDPYGQSATKDLFQMVNDPGYGICYLPGTRPIVIPRGEAGLTNQSPAPSASAPQPASAPQQGGIVTSTGSLSLNNQPAPIVPVPVSSKTSTPTTSTPTPTPVGASKTPISFVPVPPVPMTSIPVSVTNVAVAINSIMNYAVNTFQLTIAESMAVVAGVAGAVGNGAVGTMNKYYNLIFHPIETRNNLSSLDLNKLADEAIEAANAKMNAIIYINADDYVSVYNSGSALGETLVDFHDLIGKLDGLIVEKKLKGLEIVKVEIDVSDKANKIAEKEKITKALIKAQEIIKAKQK